MTDQIRDIANVIIEATMAHRAPSEEDKQLLAKIVEYFRTWFASPERRVTDAACFSIDKFAEAEVDHVTPGERGYGRTGDNPPRLGARHRSIVARMTSEQRQLLTRLIRMHIISGYLFAENSYTLSREDEQPLTTQALFEMWIPSIYTSFFNFAPRDRFEANKKTEWFRATAIKICQHLESQGAIWQDFDTAILMHFFNAGILLRMLESRPINREQLLNIATGGGYSIAQALSASTGGKHTIHELKQAINGATGGGSSGASRPAGKTSGCAVLLAVLLSILALAAVVMDSARL